MEMRQLIKLMLGAIKHPIYFFYTYHGSKSSISLSEIERKQNIREVSDWLLTAQNKSSDGMGYSRKYSLISGWDKGYIETTGYIIPTMLDVSDYLSDERYANSALQSADWLLSKQLDNGAFPDIDMHLPQVFDTGQVLLGLNRLIRHGKDKKFIDAADKAAMWLTSEQEDDGAWVRYAYNSRPHSYYTRVAAALYDAGKLLNKNEYCNSAIRYFDWVIDQQLSNGFFQYSEFAEHEPSLLHTVVYVLEGLIMIYDLTGEEKFLNMAIKGSENLIEATRNHNMPHSRYGKTWKPIDREYCITGLAQWAGLCCDLFRLTKLIDYKQAAEFTLNYLDGTIVNKGADIKGALPSSVPFWGYYGGMEFYNWNAKFYIDSMMKFSEIMKG